MKNSKTVIIVTGPTASGKTELSLQLASHYKTNIISADSRQCFKELNIGVAKPLAKVLNTVKHYFINSHSILENVNAKVFEKYALKAAEEIFKENDIAIMAGGTGMYIKAFCEGLDEIPEIDFTIRNEITKNYQERGLTWLQAEVEKNDRDFWMVSEQKNPQRLIRALEVFYSTGKSISKFRQNKKEARSFNIIKFGIDLPKKQLHENIDMRTDKMIELGLIDEAASLKNYQYINALQTVGYKESFNYLNKHCTLEETVEKIKTHTKQYAKRQLTWFKNDKEIKWINSFHEDFTNSMNVFDLHKLNV